MIPPWRHQTPWVQLEYRLVDICYMNTKHSTQHPGPTIFVHLFEEALFYNWSFFALFVSNARYDGRKILGHLLSSKHTPNKAFLIIAQKIWANASNSKLPIRIHWKHTLSCCLIAISNTCPTIAVFSHSHKAKPTFLKVMIWTPLEFRIICLANEVKIYKMYPCVWVIN